MHVCNRFIMADSIEERVLALQVDTCYTTRHKNASSYLHSYLHIHFRTNKLSRARARQDKKRLVCEGTLGSSDDAMAQVLHADFLQCIWC